MVSFEAPFKTLKLQIEIQVWINGFPILLNHSNLNLNSMVSQNEEGNIAAEIGGQMVNSGELVCQTTVSHE